MQSLRRRMTGHPTLVLAAVCGVIVVVVVIVSLTLRDARSVSMDSATLEVGDGIDRIAGALPAGAVLDSVTASTTRPCPDGSAGRLLAVGRTITLATGFDAAAWAAELARDYSAEGWTTRTSTLGTRDHLRTTLVSPTLMIYTVTTGSDDPPGVMRIRADSRCTTR
jgi:hypothetical protein